MRDTSKESVLKGRMYGSVGVYTRLDNKGLGQWLMHPIQGFLSAYLVAGESLGLDTASSLFL